MMSTTDERARLRLFCALELPAELRARAWAHLARLRESAPQVRATWEQEAKLHITLKFLGETEAARLEALTAATERAAAHVSPFGLTIAGAGAFPAEHNPRVLWLGTADPTGLSRARHARAHPHRQRGRAPPRAPARADRLRARLISGARADPHAQRVRPRRLAVYAPRAPSARRQSVRVILTTKTRRHED